MKEKLGSALFCLVFVLAFGGVGAGASYVIGATIRDGLAAREWVRVKADVETFGEGRVLYRYTVDGKRYSGDRLGTNGLGGTDDLDGWYDDLEAWLGDAKAAGKPITVFVNPDNPSESMVDREIRWRLMVFLTPFALGFGGLGVVALWMMVRTLFPDAPPAKGKSKGRKRSKPDSNLGILWVFAYFWNVISFPVAILAIPPMLADGQWLALLLGILPLVGVVMLYAAIVSTIKAVRGKKAPVQESKARPRMVETAPPLADEAAPVLLADEPRPVSLGPGFESIEQMLGGAGVKLTREQQSTFTAMSREERANLSKLIKWAPMAKKVVLGIFLLFVAFQVLGLFAALLSG